MVLVKGEQRHAILREFAAAALDPDDACLCMCEAERKKGKIAKNERNDSNWPPQCREQFASLFALTTILNSDDEVYLL